MIKANRKLTCKQIISRRIKSQCFNHLFVNLLYIHSPFSSSKIGAITQILFYHEEWILAIKKARNQKIPISCLFTNHCSSILSNISTIWSSAVISCCLAIMLVQHFVAGKTNVSEKQDHFIYAIRDSLLEGILSFMGCLLLGFLFGKEALKLDISTIAIGIGSTLSSCVGYAPKYLIENLENWMSNITNKAFVILTDALF